MERLELIIVDDEEAHFKLMERAVRKEFSQASIHYFPEALSFLEAIGAMEPDLVIVDYLMPGMTGLRCLEELRLKNKTTPVIMITGQGDESIAVQALKSGAADYVVKTPDFFKLLPGRIEKVLREQKLNDSLRKAEQALEISQRFLETANRSVGLSSLIEDFTLLAKQFTGCSVATIRLLEEGQSAPCANCEFYDRGSGASESCPSAASDQCPCICAISPAPPRSPYYTKSGAFYTKVSASALEDFPECKKGMAHSGACSLFGYKSFALVPLRLGDSILGLLHVADPKKNMLSEHVVEILEGAAMELGTTIQRLRSNEELRKAHDELEMRVKERTLELASTNEKLQEEIEERIRTQEALSKSTEELKLFAYSVMHDLKSPTIGIYGLTRLLSKQYADTLEEKGRRYCEQILKASEYCSVLVELINSYISTKESPLKIEEILLNDLLRAVMEEFSARLSIRQIRFIQPES